MINLDKKRTICLLVLTSVVSFHFYLMDLMDLMEHFANNYTYIHISEKRRKIDLNIIIINSEFFSILQIVE